MKIKRSKRRIGHTRRIAALNNTTSRISGYTDNEAKLLKRNAIVDPFVEDYGDIAGGIGSSLSVLSPNNDLSKIAGVISISNMLRQCIEVMVTNTTAYGYMLEYVGPEGQESGKEQQEEKRKLSALLNDPSPGESLRQILERFAWDKESLGFRSLEVVRNPETNEIVAFNHVPAISVRKTKPDKSPTLYEEQYIDPDTGELETRLVAKRFRRFVQKVGTKKVYFKEIGDPRNISSETGEEVTDSVAGRNSDVLATELIWDEFYIPGLTYGEPRWMGVLPEILGSRESQLVNLNFFRENAIPAMAVMVGGGTLTAESFDALEQYILAQRGQDAMQRVLILEAAADSEGSLSHSAPAPKIDFKPMISERQQDGLFKDYDIHNMQKVRSAFRLPPMLTGYAQEYTRASAIASVRTAENQVFGPERTYLDDIINKKILGSYLPRYWRFRLLGPNVTDHEELSTIIQALGTQGALTPNVVIKLANKLLGVYIEPVLEAWGDYPFDIIKLYANSGHTIQGLDEFVNAVETTLTAPAPDNNPNPAVKRRRRINKKTVNRGKNRRAVLRAVRSLAA